jgi:hypothetical protein
MVIESWNYFHCYAGELYIAQEYMASGMKDFGFVKLLHLDGRTIIKIRENIEAVGTTKWEDVVEVGKSVVAHSQVFLRGTVTSKMNGRFTVAPSTGKSMRLRLTKMLLSFTVTPWAFVT